MKPYRIVCISDTHEQAQRLTIPECDLLIHAGDITGRGHLDKVHAFNDWCGRLVDSGRVGEIVVIAGNHDITAETHPEVFQACLTECTYVQDQLIEVGLPNMKPLRLYGAPWTPSFFRQHWAFNADRGEEIRRHWAKIPDCDILVTHGPPYGVCDKNLEGEHVGCADLRNVILRKRPKIHVCGHIHEGYGTALLGRTTVINASSCTRAYRPENPPITIDIDVESL